MQGLKKLQACSKEVNNKVKKTNKFPIFVLKYKNKLRWFAFLIEFEIISRARNTHLVSVGMIDPQCHWTLNGLNIPLNDIMGVISEILIRKTLLDILVVVLKIS